MSLPEDIIIETVMSKETLNNYGLKWGMSINESEGYLKQISQRSVNEISANGINLGRKSQFILFFEEDKLESIAVYNIISGENQKRFSNANEAYFIYFGMINQLLNPQNRNLDSSIRNLGTENFRLEDEWLYNYGKSKLTLKTLYLQEYEEIVSAVIYSGDFNTNVYPLSQKDLELQTYVTDKLLKNLFKKKVTINKNNTYKSDFKSIKIDKKVVMFFPPDGFSQIIKTLQPNQIITLVDNKLYGEYKTYFKIRADGVIGYISKDSL